MSRIWRISVAVGLLCVALAAMANGATAAKSQDGKDKPAGGRLDPSFGRKGVAKIATPAPKEGESPERQVRMALGPKGRVYVLQGSLLLAFEADGKPAGSFGKNGRVKIESTRGEVFPVALAVDSQGRVVVDGTLKLSGSGNEPSVNGTAPEFVRYEPLTEAFIARFLSDGSHDTTFGTGGEVDTTFGLPRPTAEPGVGVAYEHPLVEGTTLTVDAKDRPIVGGTFLDSLAFCYESRFQTSFVGRLTTSGANDTSYAGKGYVTGVRGAVTALAGTPEGGVATLATGRYCGPHSFEAPSTFQALTEDGQPSPALDPARPTFYAEHLIAVDSEGRSLVLQTTGSFPEAPSRLMRLLPGGTVDTTFGFGGGIPLQNQVSFATALTVDAEGRAIVAGSGSKLARYTPAGKRDRSFGPQGIVSEGGAGNETTQVTALAVDGKGRIYAAASIASSTLKTGAGIQIARYLP